MLMFDCQQLSASASMYVLSSITSITSEYRRSIRTAPFPSHSTEASYPPFATGVFIQTMRVANVWNPGTEVKGQGLEMLHLVVQAHSRGQLEPLGVTFTSVLRETIMRDAVSKWLLNKLSDPDSAVMQKAMEVRCCKRLPPNFNLKLPFYLELMIRIICLTTNTTQLLPLPTAHCHLTTKTTSTQH